MNLRSRFGAFLSISVLAVLVAPSQAAAQNASEPKRLPEIKSSERMNGPWQLFVDDHLIASKKNVTRRYHSFQKQPGNPIIVVDKPWEKWVVRSSQVLPEEDGSGFRMYYNCWSEPPDGGKKGWGSFACYATSKDGIKWEKPNLGMYEYKGSRDNNILPNSPSHVVYTPWEKDPAKRYQGFGGGGGYHSYSSPDGLHWKKESTEPVISGGDTSHFYWDPHTKLFRCTVKGGGGVSDSVGGLRRRVVGFSETADPMKFPPLRMIMAPDDIDDLWCKQDTVQRTHFYACHVLPYETMYLGMLEIYRAAEPEGYFHGPLWLELVSSRDGMHWNRAEQDPTIRQIYSLQDTSRPPLLNIGKYREFDAGMVIAPLPLLVGDELWLFYSGYDELHDLLPYGATIGLAKLRKDGFVSLDADEVRGEVVTKRFENVSGQLQVNYTTKGSIRVEVLDAEGQVSPGYERDACEPLTGNAIRGPVAWKAHKELPTGKPVRFRFVLDRAQLYSFMPGQNVKVLDEPAPVPLQALYTFEGSTDAWSDMLGEDGLQTLRNLGTCVIDMKGTPQPAFGKHSLVVTSPWRNWNRAEIVGSRELGRHFTLAAMVKSNDNGRARLFSAYQGNFPYKTSELIFEFDPRGRMLEGLRLVCKGLEVDSDKVTFEDKKYHHLAMVYDDGCVTFYLDGKAAGQRWIPGGDPVSLPRNLLIGEDATRGSDEQLDGNVDDVLVYGKSMSGEEIAALAQKGAAAFFSLDK